MHSLHIWPAYQQLVFGNRNVQGLIDDRCSQRQIDMKITEGSGGGPPRDVLERKTTLKTDIDPYLCYHVYSIIRKRVVTR